MSEITISTGHPDAGSVYAAALERVTAERDALQALLTVANERADVLTGLLRDALIYLPQGGFGTVTFVLFNRILAALKPAEASDEHVCNGCGAKGWTANCKECVPF